MSSCLLDILRWILFCGGEGEQHYRPPNSVPCYYYSPKSSRSSVPSPKPSSSNASRSETVGFSSGSGAPHSQEFPAKLQRYETPKNNLEEQIKATSPSLLRCSVHDQSVQNSGRKFPESVGSLDTIKISQDSRKARSTLPLMSPVHEQSVNKLSELPEPVKKLQLKQPLVSLLPKPKLISMESTKTSPETSESFRITQPVKISHEKKQTISPFPLHVSETIVKSKMKDVVVSSSSPLTKRSVSVPSAEDWQHCPVVVQDTQKCKISEEKAVGVRPFSSKGIWVKKTPQKFHTEERVNLSGISLNMGSVVSSSMGHVMDFPESHVGNEIDEESMQFSQMVPCKKYKLPVYPIPQHLKELIENDKVPKVLRMPLSPATYTDYFAALLYAEDFYTEKWTDFLLLDITLELHEEEVKKEIGNNYMSTRSHMDKKIFVKFEINSVPEKRPYLLSRDFVFLRHTGKKSRTFEGSFVRVMKSAYVLAEFGGDFYSQFSPNDRYDVSFSFNRVCLKRCHQAVASAVDPSFRHILFPDGFICDSVPAVSPCSSVQNIKSQEHLIVRKITTMKSGHPYLIEGPLLRHSPVGDIVRKAVLQIYRNSASCRILICAPKNRTCDFLAASLNEELPDSELFRANAAFRELHDVDDEVIPLCAYDSYEKCFTTPSLLKLNEFRVVISTYVSSFRLQNCGITTGHFTHIFLVDASGATEPESMIPLVNLAGENTTILVTGCISDRPPRVRSDIARRNGLKRSYFHRLSEHYMHSSRSDSVLAAHHN